MSIRSRKLLRRIGVVAFALVMAGLPACTSMSKAPFVIALPNGYYLQRDRETRVNLTKRAGGTVLRGPIAAYAVSGEVVAGCVGEWPRRSFGYPNETPFPDSPDCRYFILDTPTGEIEKGLDPKSWRERLKAVGAPESLQITAPVLPLA